MRRLSLTAACLLAPTMAFGGPKEDGQALFEKFIAEFNSAKAENVSKLFAADALFWGTRSTSLITGSEGVNQYFANTFKALPGAKASLTGPASVSPLTNEAIAVSALWQVTAEIEGKPAIIPLRNSITAVRRGDQWLIVSFHNSPLVTQ